MAVKTYPTKTQAVKNKKYGQTTRRRRDGKWVCEWAKSTKTNTNMKMPQILT